MNLNPKEYFIHQYGKTAREGRKLGHVTVTAATEEGRLEKLKKVQKIIYSSS